MRKLSLFVVALVAIVAAILGSSLATRAQSATRFEYSRLTPYGVAHEDGKIRLVRVGYRACSAATDEWICRSFEPKEERHTPRCASPLQRSTTKDGNSFRSTRTNHPPRSMVSR